LQLCREQDQEKRDGENDQADDVCISPNALCARLCVATENAKIVELYQWIMPCDGANAFRFTSTGKISLTACAPISAAA
jgi:hypothetical protein